MQFQNPKKLDIFNPTHFTKPTSLSKTRLQSFPKGIKTSFVVFEDGSVQMSASYNRLVSYITKNTQLSTQPFLNKNYIVRGGDVESIYLPNDKPKDGYEVEIWNAQLIPFVLVSETYKMYNNLYLQHGDNLINVFPNHLVRLRFFENSWSLLIF
jgi:hypothetical protein